MKQQEKSKISESGAIMLEMVAVLSLMGLMGAMLFRQIYMRNQELHNIQMASEIRVVKDAFAAWIQANAAQITAECPSSPTGLQECTAENPSFYSQNDLRCGVKDFLPDGYFYDNLDNGQDGCETNVEEFYTFHLFRVTQGQNAGEHDSFYGLVVPTENTLPSGDEWNFRRAARVAMLIGVDGGAYDTTITGGEIAGAMGTWSLDPVADMPDPSYVANTGMDVFQPEIELPPVEVNLPNDWDLALRNAHAYNFFSVGGGSACYTISHNIAQNGVIDSDTVPANSVFAPNCLPAFYVESKWDNTDPNNPKEKGHVYVGNDLHIGNDVMASGSLNVGYDAGNLGANPPVPASARMRFDKNGMIVWERDEVSDPQDNNNKNYMIDAPYTSVMNDIKLMSRGGAHLSDILPDYILKEQSRQNCTIAAGSSDCSISNITKPTCPTGYNIAVAVIPIDFQLPASGEITATDSDNDGSHDTHTFAADENSLSIKITTATAGGFSNDEEFQGSDDAGDWTILMSYNKNVTSAATLNVIVQTYCVFDENQFQNGSGDSLIPNATRPCDEITDENTCEFLGCTWSGSPASCSGTSNISTKSP